MRARGWDRQRQLSLEGLSFDPATDMTVGSSAVMRGCEDDVPWSYFILNGTIRNYAGPLGMRRCFSPSLPSSITIGPDMVSALRSCLFLGGRAVLPTSYDSVATIPGPRRRACRVTQLHHPAPDEADLLLFIPLPPQACHYLQPRMPAIVPRHIRRGTRTARQRWSGRRLDIACVRICGG
jgi:hypothetical protein